MKFLFKSLNFNVYYEILANKCLFCVKYLRPSKSHFDYINFLLIFFKTFFILHIEKDHHLS